MPPSADPVLADSVAGELISSEIEIRSGRGEDLGGGDAPPSANAGGGLFALAADQGVALGATGTHPWSDYREQQIIDTEHYHRVEEGLKYVAWRNNTFSLHVHVGIRGADRAVLVCDRLRPVLPLLLAISASSPFLDGRDSGLHSARTQIFTKSFPRCGVPDAFGSWHAFADYIDFLVRTRSIVEYTQVWWSVRPHFSFGTVEVRICDAQTTAAESEALAGADRRLRRAGRARYRRGRAVQRAPATADRGEPVARDALRPRRRAARPRPRRGLPGREALERLLAWTAPVRAELGIEVALPALNGAQRQRRMVDAGVEPGEIYAAVVAETRETYAGSAAQVTREGVAVRCR